MITSIKECYRCKQPRKIWKVHEGKRYCYKCWCHIKFVTDKKKPTNHKSLPSRSSKKIIQDKEYTQLRKAFLLKHPLCQIHIPGICDKFSSEIHHKKGRGEYYLDISTWIACCRNCHSWAETHPEEAKELGFSESRLEEE